MACLRGSIPYFTTMVVYMMVEDLIYVYYLLFHS